MADAEIPRWLQQVGQISLIMTNSLKHRDDSHANKQVTNRRPIEGTTKAAKGKHLSSLSEAGWMGEIKQVRLGERTP